MREGGVEAIASQEISLNDSLSDPSAMPTGCSKSLPHEALKKGRSTLL